MPSFQPLSTILKAYLHRYPSLPLPTTEKPRKNAEGQTFTREEIRRHCTLDSLWIIVNNQVYDLTKWIHSHPGGDLPLLHMAGKDATDLMRAFHPDYVFEQKLPAFHIGSVEMHMDGENSDLKALTPAEQVSAVNNALSVVTANTISKNESLTEDVNRRTFAADNCPIDDVLKSAVHDETVNKKTTGDLAGKSTLTTLDVAYIQLEKYLQDSGMYETNYQFYYKHAARLIVVFILALTCVFQAYWSQFDDTSVLAAYIPTGWSSFVYTLVGSFLMAFFWHQLAFIAHDAGHNGITHSRSADHAIGLVTGNLLTGLSAGWWKHNHNVHHVVTNHPSHDPDIQHMPFLAITAKFFERVWSTYYRREIKLTNFSRAMLKIQHYLYLPLLTLGRFNLHVHSITFLLGKRSSDVPAADSAVEVDIGVHPDTSMEKASYNKAPKIYRRGWEIFCLAFFWSWFIGLCSFIPTWSQCLLYVFISHAATFVLHIQITLSHFAMSTDEPEDGVDLFSSLVSAPCAKCDEEIRQPQNGSVVRRRGGCPHKEEKDKKSNIYVSEGGFPMYCTSEEEYPRRQLRTTMDIDCPEWFDWFHGGLQFQVEHHLFPRIPRHNLRQVRKLVEEYCRLIGLEYKSLGFMEANGVVFRTLAKIATQADSWPEF